MENLLLIKKSPTDLNNMYNVNILSRDQIKNTSPKLQYGISNPTRDSINYLKITNAYQYTIKFHY